MNTKYHNERVLNIVANNRATSITCICKSYAYCFSRNIVRDFDCCPSLNYGNSLLLDYFVKQAI